MVTVQLLRTSTPHSSTQTEQAVSTSFNLTRDEVAAQILFQIQLIIANRVDQTASIYRTYLSHKRLNSTNGTNIKQFISGIPEANIIPGKI